MTAIKIISDVEMEIGDFKWVFDSATDVWLAIHDGESVASVHRMVDQGVWRWDVAVNVIPNSDGGDRDVVGAGGHETHQRRALVIASTMAREFIITARARFHLLTDPNNTENAMLELRSVCGNVAIGRVASLVVEDGFAWEAGLVGGREALRGTATEKVVQNASLPSRSTPQEPTNAEVDLEQLSRTKEALSWVEEPEEDDVLLKREDGVSAEDWDPPGFNTPDLLKVGTAKMTINGMDVPVNNVQITNIPQTGMVKVQALEKVVIGEVLSREVDSVRPARHSEQPIGVALGNADAGELVTVQLGGTGFVRKKNLHTPPNHPNARCSSRMPHDFEIDQQGNVQITAKHPGTFQLQYPPHLTTPGWPIPENCKPTGSFDELVRREEALASRELVKAALREGKLATMHPRYLRAAEEAIDKLALSGSDGMPRMVNDVGAVYEQAIRAAEK